MRDQESMAWMLAEAVDLLQSADRFQRQFFRMEQARAVPCWEPPVDMCEYERGLLGVLVALPGVVPDSLEVFLEDAAVIVRGERSFGTGLGEGEFLRLEIPYGEFERRIPLPFTRAHLIDMQLENGCLRLHIERLP